MEMETKTKKKLSENILEKFSMDFLRNQVLKNAYGNNDTVIAKLDSRILIVWYLFFGLVPWFVNDLCFLMACFLLVVVTTKLARVAGLVLLVFAVGVFSQTGYLLLVSLLFGGNASTIAPLLVLSLKVATCSLASVTVFSGLDPDKLSNGLMWYGCPERLSFSISYAYRVLPMLMEEFQNILLSFRLRGNPPSREKLWGKGEVSLLPGESDYARLLPPDAQHSQALPHDGGGPGDPGLPKRCQQQGGETDEAGHLKSDHQRPAVFGHLPAVDFSGHFALHFDLEKRYSIETGFSHAWQAGKTAALLHSVHRLAFRRGQKGRSGRPLPD